MALSAGSYQQPPLGSTMVISECLSHTHTHTCACTYIDTYILICGTPIHIHIAPKCINMHLVHADTNANPYECTREYNHTQAYMLIHDTREVKQAHIRTWSKATDSHMYTLICVHNHMYKQTHTMPPRTCAQYICGRWPDMHMYISPRMHQ